MYTISSMANVPDIPIPTDNLYKFLAIAGLTISLFSLAMNTISVNQYAEKRIQLLSDISGYRIQTDKLIRELGSKNPESQTISAQTRELESHVEELSSIVKITRDSFDRVTKLQNMGVLFGFFISATGFFLWYWKLQRYEDLALESRSTAAKYK